jgi:hypothetical protein
MEHGSANMVGKSDSTIVMTGFGDDYRDLACFGPGVKGTWGGLIIKGMAPVSNAPDTNGNYPTMEGIATYEPDSVKTYGKGPFDSADNSGTYQYLSIRHGGAGRSTNSEINGISFYGVGAGTQMDHIEVMSNYDDGVEFFGGNVNVKYLCISFCDDDQFDLDQGYSGHIQFALGVELNWMGNRCGEWDNLKNRRDGYHTLTGPTIANMTVIGCGKYTTNTVENQNYGANYLFQLADSLKGTYRNILALDQMGKAFWMRDHDILPSGTGMAPMGDANGPDFKGLMVYHTKANYGTSIVHDWSYGDDLISWDSLVQASTTALQTATVTYLKTAANKCFCNVDPKICGVSREFDFPALDPRPEAGSPALSSSYYAATPSDPFFTTANYVGAFDSANIWCDGWTKLSQAHCLTSYLTTFPEKAIVPASGSCSFSYILNIPNAQSNLASVTATLDGVSMGSFLKYFYPVTNMTKCVGTSYVIGSVPWTTLATLEDGSYPTGLGAARYNYRGLHDLAVTFKLSDGRSFTGTTRMEIKK